MTQCKQRRRGRELASDEMMLACQDVSGAVWCVMYYQCCRLLLPDCALTTVLTLLIGEVARIWPMLCFKYSLFHYQQQICI